MKLVVQLGVVVAVAAAVLLTSRGGAPQAAEPSHPRPAKETSSSYERRAFELALVEPNLRRAEIANAIERSDRVFRTGAALGEDERDTAARIRRMLREYEPSESEVAAYFDRERELFGDRGLEASREVIVKLLAVQHARRELGL